MIKIMIDMVKDMNRTEKQILATIIFCSIINLIFLIFHHSVALMIAIMYSIGLLGCYIFVCGILKLKEE